MESLKETQKRFDQLMQDLKSGDYYLCRKKGSLSNWTAYSQARVNELRFVIKLIKENVDSVNLPPKPMQAGQPAKEASDLAKAVLLQQYMQVSERVAIGWIELLSPVLGITSNFEWRSLARAYEREDVRFILERVFEKSTEPVQGIATNFSGDSTGLEESRKDNYEVDAHGKNASSYAKLTSFIASDFHVVTSYALTRNSGDCAVFEDAFQLTAEKQKPKIVCLDAGFVSRDICNAVASVGALPFIYPKRGLTLKKKGSKAWKDMLVSLVHNPQEWLRVYHERSNVECWHSMLKRRFSRPLQCKTLETQASEVCARITIANFTQLCTAFYEGRLPKAAFAS